MYVIIFINMGILGQERGGLHPGTSDPGWVLLC